MEARTYNPRPRPVADMYKSVLSTLSVDDKLDIIAWLSSSIKTDKRKTDENSDLYTMFCGEWGDMSDLRSTTYTGREIAGW